MARTLVRAHTLLTQSTRHGSRRGGAVLVEDGRIQQVGAVDELERQGPFDSVLGDPERHIVLPGMVNGHHHSLRPPRIGLRASPLETWLVRSRLREVPTLSEDEAYDHTLWGTLQFLKSGATAVVDHFLPDPRMEEGGVPPAVAAYLDAGVRATVCVACSDQQRLTYQDDEAFLASIPSTLAEALRPALRPFDQDRFFASWEQLAAMWDGQDGRIRIGFGPGGPQWCSDDLLRRLRRTADEHGGAPIQIHLLESKFQALYGQRRYGTSIVRHLADIEFFGRGTSCAHCAWLSREDMALLADVGAVAVHNPSSNLVLFNGIAPVADMLDAGMKVGFGLDAAGLNDDLDMLTDLRLGLFLQRRPGFDRREVTAADMLALATHGGAEAIGLGPLGRLEEGYPADIVLIDRTRLYAWPYVDPAAPADEVVLRRAKARDVDHVLVGGKVVIQDGRAIGVDEVALERRVRQSLERTYEQVASMDALFEKVEPYVSAFYGRWEQELDHLLPANFRVNTQ